MTPQPVDIERIKAYCEKATAGQWAFSGLRQIRNEHKRIIDAQIPEPGTPDYPNLKADMKFIAESRKDLPACVEEIAILRRALEEIADLTGGVGTVGIVARNALGR